jgi:hypothetical protein
VTNTIRSIVVPAVVGLVAGVGGALVTARASHPPTPNDRSAPPTNRLDNDINASRERQVRAAAEVLVNAAALAAKSAPENPRAALSPAEEGIRRQRQHEDLLANHLRETVDPEWAQRSSVSVSSELKTLAESRHFSLLELDCRRTSCVADIEWQSYADARTEYDALLHGRFSGINCGSEILVPPGTGGPIRTKLILSGCR